MVSFSCEACGDVLLKKKLDSHRRQCQNASYTCLDCMVNFKKFEYRAHTSCVSEAQKYQGSLYRSEKPKNGKKKEGSLKSSISIYSRSERAASIYEPQSSVNVFDFLENDGASHLNDLEYLSSESKNSENPPSKPTHILGEISGNKTSKKSQKTSVSTKTPTVKKKSEHSTEKTDNGDVLNGTKRKRLHLESRDSASQIVDVAMRDASPVVLHSELTGDISRLMRRPSSFSPSPDLVETENVDPIPASPTPTSPPKKNKGIKKRKEPFSIGSGVKAFMTAKAPPTKQVAKLPLIPSNRLIEDQPKIKRRTIQEYEVTSDREREDRGNSEHLLVYQPRSKQVQLLFGLIEKGLESPRGVSMSKALKKFHREREMLGLGPGKVANEKELWKDLRIRRNDRGELVLFV